MEPGSMTKAQYRAALAALALSQVQAAHIFQMHPRTSRRWALGEDEVPVYVDIILSYWLQTGIAPDELLPIRDLIRLAQERASN